jgi:hypothetical protein
MKGSDSCCVGWIIYQIRAAKTADFMPNRSLSHTMCQEALTVGSLNALLAMSKYTHKHSLNVQSFFFSSAQQLFCGLLATTGAAAALLFDLSLCFDLWVEQALPLCICEHIRQARV